MKNKAIFLILFTVSLSLKAQKKAILIPYKIGFLYNNADERNFLFDDTDYSYTTSTFKLQAFYKIANWKGFNFELIIQPQVQFLQHQLFNEQFILPSEKNFEAKRARFTSKKNMSLYSLEFGFSVNKKIIEKLFFQTTASVGISYIDTETERLAKGFTFIENGSIGFAYKTSPKTAIYFGGNIGHLSNFDFLEPNGGYNILGYEVGFQYFLH